MTPAKQVDIEQGTPQWHVWRHPLLGASDISALFVDDRGHSVSPYKTARDLWFEKSGLGEPEDEDRSWLFRKGHEVEAELRQMFSKYKGIAIRPTCFERGIFGASLDGYDKTVGVFEAKYVGKEALKAISEGEIPPHHRIQVQCQLYASDSDKGVYGARGYGSTAAHVIEFGRDEKLIKSILKKAEAFMESIHSGTPPELAPDDTLFISEKSAVNVFNALSQLKRMKDKLEAEYEELEKKAKEFATHSKVRCGNVLIVEAERSGSIDYLKIPEVKALAEEYIEKFRKRSSRYKTIRFAKVD